MMATDDARLISSQRFRDPEIIEAKREAADYGVLVYPLSIDGVAYRVVIDGHHSLDAARIDGVEPMIREVTGAARAELDELLEANGPDGWLVSQWVDDQYYFLDTGLEVF